MINKTLRSLLQRNQREVSHLLPAAVAVLKVFISLRCPNSSISSDIVTKILRLSYKNEGNENTASPQRSRLKDQRHSNVISVQNTPPPL